MMEYREVESQNLSTVGYDREQNLLEITFHTGLTYRYFEVTEAVFRALVEAESKGKYFNTWIRGKYKYTRISGK